MRTINWRNEIKKREGELIQDLQSLIQIPSVKSDQAAEDAPFGREVRQALDFMLELGEKSGFRVKNTGNVAGHLEMGQGEELIGILCHVDVVPPGDGWSYKPFEGEVEDGKIFGRGAIDDKGPTIAAYYAMKTVQELGIPLEKRIRMIVGTDEESTWQCVEHYFKTEEMPGVGFAPDADFPIIFAEKGIADVQLNLTVPEPGQADIQIESFQAGSRYNMVPDYAKAAVWIEKQHTLFLQNYTEYIKDNDLEGSYYIDGGIVFLEMNGVSAHAAEPKDGQNAALFLADFLVKEAIDPAASAYLQFVIDNFKDDTRGHRLGIASTDAEMGDVTVNAALFCYEKQQKAQIGLNIRYPVSFSFEEEIHKLKEYLSPVSLQVLDNNPPHYTEPDDPFVQTLKRVYEEETGEEAKLLSTGGGTYARALKRGVAFGALFPGRADVAHQKDEYAVLDDLFRAAAIYARAIVELAGKKN
ncbi:dipeptidase PepV [Domibacillus indicus]|uniref:dipeptidase PepV n=1 Tax=Domibacillus indicus TaxID=1437523 RepID=UPI00203BA1CF|nr:dipeptidase PepV [Domibacillus indicus]MCM3787005.1 dipeptidase PepV [Domibacillus indicus]